MNQIEELWYDIDFWENPSCGSVVLLERNDYTKEYRVTITEPCGEVDITDEIGLDKYHETRTASNIVSDWIQQEWGSDI